MGIRQMLLGFKSFLWELATGGTCASTRAGAIASISLQFNTDGSLTRAVGTSTDISTGMPSNWYSSVVGGIGNSYWVRCTVLTGAVTTGSGTGVWLALSAMKEFGQQQNVVGTVTATVLIELASDAAGTAIAAAFNCTIATTRT